MKFSISHGIVLVILFVLAGCSVPTVGAGEPSTPLETVSVLVVGNGIQSWGNYNGLPHPDTEPGAELHYANEDTVADVLSQNMHGPSFAVDVLGAWSPESGVAPLDLSQVSLESFDVLVWFLHNDFSISDDPENGRFTNLVGLQNEELLLAYLDNGGGLVAIHHSIWSGSQSDLEGNSIPLLTSAVGAELSFADFNSAGTAFLGHAAEFRIRARGHYIVRNGIERPWQNLVLGPPEEMWFGVRFDPDLLANDTALGYRRLFDYRGAEGTAIPAGWTRTYNPNGDTKSGRVVFLQPGDTVERSFGDERYRQMVRNATAWAGSDE